MEKIKLFIVDDDKTLLKFQSDLLRDQGYQVFTATSGEQALKLAKNNHPDILLTDLVMPGIDGIVLINRIRGIAKETVSIVLTGYGTVETAVEAMKAGAFTYLTKPYKMTELLVTIEKAIEVHKLKKENVTLKQALGSSYKNFIIGNSEEMQKVFELIETVADTDSTILIFGESGTGKELVAKRIHYLSSRRNGQFIPINCGAIPENLLESELFGHVKGAFTGAVAGRQGRFELAKGGTIFLDEIGDMSPKLQVKLLRVLQEREFEPVGSTRTKKADVRVIAATHKDLEKAVKEEKFREDLYYRLNVIPVHIPALRERKDDIPILIDHFIKRFNKEKKRSVEKLSPEGIEILSNYSWPGNVRELENLIERLVIIKREGIIETDDLPDKIVSDGRLAIGKCVQIADNGISLKDAVEEFENSLIFQALNRCKWNKNRAAMLLGIKRTTLVEKLKKKGIKTPD